MEVEVIGEASVSLTVNGEVWLSFMCTPIELEAMAIGFLFNEGLLHSKDEIASVRVCQAGDNVDVWLNHNIEKPQNWRRTSGCTGGVTSVNNHETYLDVSPISVLNGVTLTPENIARLIAQLFESQDLYRTAGGVHTSALSDGQHILVAVEDIGRHNTLDKIAGRCLLEGIASGRRILLTTGRISSEMMQKATRIGASIVISRTSPTALSIEIAERQGITLVGYARRDRFNIYTHPERIISSATCQEATPERRKPAFVPR
jgi:FdhD protein